MRHPLVSLAALGALLSPLLNAGTGAQGQPLSASDVTSVRSIVGGVAPQWSPDGARLLIGGALGGSDLWTVPAAGGL
ncbi:MAG: hypothetical protein ACK55A_04000, partial [Gemmatimonas sp.]